MFLQTKGYAEKLMGFPSFNKMMKEKPSSLLMKVLVFVLALSVIVLVLPWTQNIQSVGNVSTINPGERPQNINSIIAGRIEKWYVQDGQLVKAGDTLLKISEVKEEYLDSSLLERTALQVKAKNEAVVFYNQKADMANQQQSALNQSLRLKLDQTENKLKQYKLQIQSDSIAYIAAKNQYNISREQLNRQQQLFDAGIKTLTEFEQKQQYFQEALAKKIGTENKYFNSKNELLNIQLELLALKQENSEKIAKSDSEKFGALSQASTTEGEVVKLQNMYANYKKRQGFYVITAPQSGQVVRTTKAGIGEVVKDGESLMQIIPTDFEPAVEMYVDALNIPLIFIGQKVQIQFDGFPAIIFSGWPDASFGVFEGRIVAVDKSMFQNGKFRVWVRPTKKQPWPKSLMYGIGTKNISLLNDVPLIYELWRQINGFPPEFYSAEKVSK